MTIHINIWVLIFAVIFFLIWKRWWIVAAFIITLRKIDEWLYRRSDL